MSKTFRIGKIELTFRATHGWTRHWKLAPYIIFLGCQFGRVNTNPRFVRFGRNFEVTLLNFSLHLNCWVKR